MLLYFDIIVVGDKVPANKYADLTARRGERL